MNRKTYPSEGRLRRLRFGTATVLAGTRRGRNPHPVEAAGLLSGDPCRRRGCRLGGPRRGSRRPWPYRISRFAADVAELTSRLVPQGAVLVGHSMGAAVCLDAARLLGSAAERIVGVDALLFPARLPRAAGGGAAE
jgi:pimeloyl-ACP methyl ester carboxylesterase